MESTRQLIYSYFVINNENNILNVDIYENDIIESLKLGEEIIKEELDKLVLEQKFHRRYLDYRYDDVPSSGIYYQVLKDGLLEIFQQYKISLTNDDTTKALREVIDEIRNSNIDKINKERYLQTLQEILDTYIIQSYASTISMCGKTLEIYLTEYLKKYEPSLLSSANRNLIDAFTLGQLFNKARHDIRNKSNIIDKITEKKIDLIIIYRNGSVHFNESIPIPSKEELTASINLVVDLIRRRISIEW